MSEIKLMREDLRKINTGLLEEFVELNKKCNFDMYNDDVNIIYSGKEGIIEKLSKLFNKYNINHFLD